MTQKTRTRLNLHKLSFEELHKLYLETFDEYPDFRILNKAYLFTEQAHRGQVRDHKQEVPYIVHMLRMIINMYTNYRITDRNMLKAALLHDTVEDTDVKLEEIKQKFGEQTANYVKALTRPRAKGEDQDPRIKVAAKKKKFEELLKSSKTIRQLKLFDLIDNMQDWLEISDDDPLAGKFPRWLQEAEDYYLPMAESIGPKYTEPVKTVIQQLNARGFHAQSGNYKA